MNLINKKKLRAAINEVSRNRKNPQLAPQQPEPWSIDMTKDPAWNKHWDDLNAYRKANSAERATALCSLMAHSRGKLHVTKEWVPTYLADGGQKLVTRTLEDQEKLVAVVAKEFEADVAYVVYEVDGFPGPKMAGPYTASEVISQFTDICGYQGVHNARITASIPPALMPPATTPSGPAAGVPTAEQQALIARCVG